MKITKKSALLFGIPAMMLIMAFTFVKDEKGAETEWAKMYLPIWENAKAQTLAIAEAMPEDKYNYKPTDSSKTLPSK